jgi:hypothetical protein
VRFGFRPIVQCGSGRIHSGTRDAHPGWALILPAVPRNVPQLVELWCQERVVDDAADEGLLLVEAAGLVLIQL